MKKTFEQYDTLVDTLEGIALQQVFWPEETDFALFEKEPEKWLPYLVYMSEIASPKDKKEEYALNEINRFLRKHLELTD